MIERHWRTNRLSRRRLAAVFGALSISLWSRVAGADRAVVYLLDPNGVDPLTGRSCSGCSACRRHAENKRFASAEIADLRRAHPNCRCAIRAVAVSRRDYEAFFGRRGETPRDEVDIRHAGGLEMPAVRVR